VHHLTHSHHLLLYPLIALKCVWIMRMVVCHNDCDWTRVPMRAIALLLIGLFILATPACGDVRETRVETVVVRITATPGQSREMSSPTSVGIQGASATSRPVDRVRGCLTVSALNVRAGPSSSYPIIGGLSHGECVWVDAVSDDHYWGRTTSRSWREPIHGWVALSYLDIEGHIDLLREALPDPTPTKKWIQPTATRPPAPIFATQPLPPSPRPSNCDPCYPSVCIPKVSHDLDCKDIPYCRFRVTCDPHGFDGDHDGIGCEWCN